jgi:hypothetical protein
VPRFLVSCFGWVLQSGEFRGVISLSKRTAEHEREADLRLLFPNLVVAILYTVLLVLLHVV